jgi:hypothetical protein
MKLWPYIISIILGVVCIELSITTVIIARNNMSLQNDIQLRQQQLNNSILNPQSQQIANTVLQDMAGVASTNAPMRALLGKYGYKIQTAGQPNPVDKTPEPKSLEKNNP